MPIRQAEKKDLDALVKLEKSTFSDPWTKETLLAELEKDNGYYIVYEEEGIVSGYAGIWTILSEGEVARVAVDQTKRCQGIGRMLTYALIDYVYQKQLEAVFLEVRESNVPARKIYTEVGFKEIGTRKNYYAHPTENAIIMSYDTILM